MKTWTVVEKQGCPQDKAAGACGNRPLQILPGK
jgi:hypothetical protein